VGVLKDGPGALRSIKVRDRITVPENETATKKAFVKTKEHGAKESKIL